MARALPTWTPEALIRVPPATKAVLAPCPPYGVGGHRRSRSVTARELDSESSLGNPSSPERSWPLRPGTSSTARRGSGLLPRLVTRASRSTTTCIRGQVLYVAIRDIEIDEELCHDYAMDRTDDYRLECACGTLACRGTVTGEDWRLPEVQARYEGFFVEYVAEKIRRAAAD